MDNHQKVTITISAEEFNRFQGSEKNMLDLTAENNKLLNQQKFDHKELKELREKVHNLKNSVEVLENSKKFVKVKGARFYSDEFGRHYYRNEVYNENLYMSVELEEAMTHRFLDIEFKKLELIPKWIRKIFGAI